MQMMWPRLQFSKSLFFPAVRVDFMEVAVTATEGDGSVTLTVFVTGQLSSAVSVSVQVATEDGTATGKKLCVLDNYNHFSFRFKV